MFAHGEGELIERAFNSVRQHQEDVALGRVVILANGASEETWAVTERLIRDDPRVEALRIEFGDKCNAWNAYVHGFASDVSVHFFMDSDCWVIPDSLPQMVRRLREEPELNAVAGLPFGGWRGGRLRHLVTHHRWIFGGLYAVRHTHLKAIQDQGVRLPVGLYGNDHFVTQIMWSDSRFETVDAQRVASYPGSGFGFDRLSPWRRRDWRAYVGQQIRYRHREFQIARLRGTNLRQLPATMDDVNREILMVLKGGDPPGFRAARAHLRTRTSIYDPLLRRRLEQVYSGDDDRPLERIARANRTLIRAGMA